MVQALLKETELRKDYLAGASIGTIYFGGGTPSLLETGDLKKQIDLIRDLFRVELDAEITLEANPDDITEEKLIGWKESGINRLSIGVQSFFEEDLRWMNRAHDASQAVASLQSAIRVFQNISIDLIYGTPGLTNEKWKENVDRAIEFGVPHLSCYALTVEPKTPLEKMIRLHQTDDINPDKQSEQFLLLMDWMEKAGYEHYEISNFAKPGWRSRHNSSYWGGKKYLGLGPSAHSFDGLSRQWNIANNNVYIQSLSEGKIPFEKETLSPSQIFNEYVMTSLRTIEGLDLEKTKKLGTDLPSVELTKIAMKFIERGLIIQVENHLMLTREGKLLADGIASEFFQ